MKQAGRKTGRLANGHKMPDKDWTGVDGLDWAKIRQQYERRLDVEWDRGIRNPDTVERHRLKQLGEEERLIELRRLERQEVKRTPSGRTSRKGQYKSKTGRPRGSLKYDIDEVVRLYVEENMSPPAIAEALEGPSPATVVEYLKRRGVHDPKRHRTGGRKNYVRQRYCGVCGADLDAPGNSEERVRKLPDGTTRPNGRECIPCRKARNNNPGRWAKDPRNPKNGGSGKHG